MFNTSFPLIFFIIVINHLYCILRLESVRLLLLFNDYSSHFNDYLHFLFFIFPFVVLPQSPTTTSAKICPILPHKVPILLHFHSPAMADEKHFYHSFVSPYFARECPVLQEFSGFMQFALKLQIVANQSRIKYHNCKLVPI